MRYFKTYTGKTMNPIDATTVEVNIIDIAHHLSNICRFSGATISFYSVAQHSVHVSKLLEMKGFSKYVQLVGLLHDATEAYLGDVTRLVKNSLPEYKKWEAALDEHIMSSLDVPRYEKEEVRAIVKEYDDTMLEYEKKALLHGADVSLPNGWLPLLPDTAKILFLERFYELNKAV